MEGILLTPICRQFKCYFINGRGDVSVKTFIFALFMPWASLIVIVTHKLNSRLSEYQMFAFLQIKTCLNEFTRCRL